MGQMTNPFGSFPFENNLFQKVQQYRSALPVAALQSHLPSTWTAHCPYVYNPSLPHTDRHGRTRHEGATAQETTAQARVQTKYVFYMRPSSSKLIDIKISGCKCALIQRAYVLHHSAPSLYKCNTHAQGSEQLAGSVLMQDWLLPRAASLLC